ncbi:MAG: hydroxyethylthiazole kinase [Treponema sp.]|nr:hydroxyethylthiazole kinase [Treponema sp.]
MITQKASAILERIREENPLIHCITNYITVNDCANILLSAGASPAMCDALDEAYDFARISAALYINFGTYIKEQEAAAAAAALGAKSAGRPIVVDPVGCAAIPRRTGILDRLHELAGVSLVKGNMGEIMALAGKKAGVKGVDSDGAIPGIEEAVLETARKYGCVVAATGKIDIISDGNRMARISNGVPMLTKITGAGCMTGALCAAAAAVARDRDEMFAAAVAAVSVMGIAGEMAGEKADLPGSFRTALIDAVYGITGKTLLERGKIECEKI